MLEEIKFDPRKFTRDEIREKRKEIMDQEGVSNVFLSYALTFRRNSVKAVECRFLALEKGATYIKEADIDTVEIAQSNELSETNL